MNHRLRNFSGGPGAIPASVIEESQEAVRALPGTGISVLSLNHRSPLFRDILDEAEQRLRRLLRLPGDYQILFLQGGGTLQFSMVPLAMLPTGSVADYVIGGYWSRKAVDAARSHGQVRVAWDGADKGYTTLPRPQEPVGAGDAAYLHYVSNETVEGLQFKWLPATTAKLVCDMSSDFLSGPLDAGPYHLIYAHAQKNLGPAGVTVVLVRDEVLLRVPHGLPPILDYRAHAQARSILHTPPVFAIYVTLLILRWLEDEIGGLWAMADINQHKARIVRAALKDAGDFYRPHAQPGFESDMNIAFRCPSAELDACFIAQAERGGLVGTEGHRSLKGLRISLYNGVTLDDAHAAARFLREFAHAHPSHVHSQGTPPVSPP